MKSWSIWKFIPKAVCAAALATVFAIAPAHAQQTPDEVDPARGAFFQKLKGKKVVFISENQASEQGEIWLQALKETLEPHGVSVEVRDAKFDPAVGAQAMTQAIAQGVNMLVVWSPDRNSYARLIKQAQQKGIWVVSMNMGSSVVADNFIGPDWMDITGRQVEASAKACQGKSGKISIVGGANNSAVDVLGMAGINAALKKHPELKVVNDQFADWDANKAKDITAAVLKQNPDLCAVIGLWNLMDVGAAAAISEAGMTGKVFMSTSGSGLADGACARIKTGAFDHYVSYNVQRQYDQIGTVVQALLGSDAKPGELKSFSFTPLTDITKENVDKPGSCWTLNQFRK
jgi:ribose transport system substrate-binding protein